MSLFNSKSNKSIKTLLLTTVTLGALIFSCSAASTPLAKKYTKLTDLPGIGAKPAYQTRGFLLDNARKYYPLAWIKKTLNYMSKLKLNELQLHFSDSEGVRIESRNHPEINSKQQLSQKELKYLLAYAAKRGITIIPDLDIPGHMTQILSKHPEFQLPSASGKKLSSTLNVMDEKAIRYAESIIDEYMKLFPDSPAVGLGFDEIFAIVGDKIFDFSNLDREAKRRYGPQADREDLVVALANRVGKRVLARGKIPYVWNDGVGESKVVKLDKRIVVRYWSHNKISTKIPSYWFKQRYQVVNFNENALYYVPGIAKLPFNLQETLQPVATLQTVYHWQPRWFPAYDYKIRPFIPEKISLTLAKGLLQGSVLSLWSNFPDLFSLEEAFEGIKPLLAEFAIRNWNPGYRHNLQLTKKVVSELAG